MTFTRKHKLIGTGLLSLLLFILGADLLIPQALALDPLVDGNNYVQVLAEKLEIFHRLFSPLVNFFAKSIGNFLGNEYIFAGTMGEMLKNLWVISRNLVNIFFVGALLWVALKAVAGDFFGEETDVKKEVLKIAVFLIVVNFSWLATKVVLDAAHVATNIAFSLPSGVSNIQEVDLGKCTLDNNNKPQGACKPTAYHFVASAKPKDIDHLTQEECKTQKIEEAYADVYPESLDGNLNPSAHPDNVAKVGDRTTFCWDNLDLFDYNQNTAVIYMTYGMAKIQNLGGSFAFSGDLTQTAVASLFSLLIQVTFTVALMALFILMLIRAAMLWLFVGFSPALVVMLYLGGGEGPIANFGPKDFIKWAFVPAQVGLILSVGFIMIAAGQANSEILGNLNQNINLSGGFYNAISIFSGMETLQGIIWLIIIELVFAIAVYAPMKDLPFAGTIIGPIADFAKNTLTSIAKTPLIAPIIPIGDKDGDGVQEKISLRDLGQGFKNKLEWRDGLSSDIKTIRKLEHQAEKLNEFLSKSGNASVKTDIVNEASRGRIHAQLDKHFDISLLKGVDEDIQIEKLKKAGFDDPQSKTIVNALKSSGVTAATAPTATPASSSSAAPPASANVTQLKTSATPFANTGNDTSRTNIINEVNPTSTTDLPGKINALKQIGINLTDLNSLSDVEKNEVLTAAGFSTQSDRDNIIKTLKDAVSASVPLA